MTKKISGSPPPLPEKWPEPVDGATLLDEIEAVITRFLFLPAGASIAIALWIVHTYAQEAAQHFPLLSALSPEKRCGKTTLLRVLKALVRQPVMTSNLTPSVIFRIVEAYRPTLLIDEADMYLEGNREMISILNAGHIRGGQVLRNAKDGNDYTPVAFSVWGSKSIAAIGTLPTTLADRSITVRLHRRPKAVQVERWESGLEHDLEALRRQMVRWSVDHLDDLRAASPAIPDALNDRAADNWWPLLAIADASSSAWGKKARDAAQALSEIESDDLTLSQLALADLKSLIEQTPDKRIKTQDLVRAMNAMSDRPWASYQGRLKGLNAIDLASLLKGYQIKPEKIRFKDQTLRQGYKLNANMQDMFNVYSTGNPEPSEHPEHGEGESWNVPNVPVVPGL